MTEDIKRVNYFDGQFLREKDFNEEQQYHVQHLRDHARLLHTPGIAEGLEIPTPPAGSKSVTVHSGVAYDNQGRRVVLADDKIVELGDYPADQALYLTITFAQKPSDPTNETGITGNTRWIEEPLVEVSASPPVDSGARLLLAKLGRTGTNVTELDLSGRRYAGVAGGDLDVRHLTLTSGDIAPDGWVTIGLAANKQAEVGGDLAVRGSIQVSGTVDGRRLATDGATLEQLSRQVEALTKSNATLVSGIPFVVPVGGVISWWRPDVIVPIPENFRVCDGSSIAAGDHGFRRADGTPLGTPVKLPDLRNAFVLGANHALAQGASSNGGDKPEDGPGINGAGGSNASRVTMHSHDMTHKHEQNLGSTGDSSAPRVGACSQFATGAAGDHAHSAVVQGVHIAWDDSTNPGKVYPTLTDPKNLWMPMLPPHNTDRQGSHSHTIAQHDHTMSHTHSLPLLALSNTAATTQSGAAISIVPRYVGLLYLMRIR